MSYDFNILCYIRFLSGFIAICLALYILIRKYSHGAVYLVFFESAAAIWAIADGFEAAATTISLKLLWSQIAYTGIATSSVFFLMFSLYYTQQIRFARKRIFAILMVIPVITIVIAFTNPFHKLLWQEIKIIEATNQSVYYYGFWFWINIFYEYSALIVGMVILLLHGLMVFRFYRANILFLLLGVILPFCASIIYVFKLVPTLGLDLTPISFIFSGIIVFISLFRLKIFDILPIAHKQVIDNLQAGMLVVDSTDRIINSNPAFNKISQLNNSQQIGCQADKILSDININIDDFTVQNEFTVETHIPVNGEQKYFEVKYHKVLDKSQRSLGKVFMLNDITTKKMILEAIADSNNSRKMELLEKGRLIKDLDAYARSVAHDLKNQIHSLIGFSELIKLKLLENDQKTAIEMLDIVNSQSHKMSQIIDSLLKLSTIRKEDIKLTPIDSAKILEEAIKRLEKQISESKTTLSKPEKWPVAMGNPQWIEEVWFNLISNGIKYGGTPPEIILGYDESSPTSCMFWIRDNGNGLPVNSLEKIFDDFERLGRKDIEGHGLGLPIVKRIIEKLGGQVNASSANKPGEGCVFSFTLLTHPVGQKE
jgi:PAS domain S-box-containing protein